MSPTLFRIGLLFAPLTALHTAEFPVLLDSPSRKPLTNTLPEPRKPAAFKGRIEGGPQSLLPGAITTLKLMRWERNSSEGELASEQFIILEYCVWWLTDPSKYLPTKYGP